MLRHANNKQQAIKDRFMIHQRFVISTDGNNSITSQLSPKTALITCPTGVNDSESRGTITTLRGCESIWRPVRSTGFNPNTAQTRCCFLVFRDSVGCRACTHQTTRTRCVQAHTLQTTCNWPKGGTTNKKSQPLQVVFFSKAIEATLITDRFSERPSKLPTFHSKQACV